MFVVCSLHNQNSNFGLWDGVFIESWMLRMTVSEQKK